jgi:hypothetical protein
MVAEELLSVTSGKTISTPLQNGQWKTDMTLTLLMDSAH